MFYFDEKEARWLDNLLERISGRRVDEREKRKGLIEWKRAVDRMAAEANKNVYEINLLYSISENLLFNKQTCFVNEHSFVGTKSLMIIIIKYLLLRNSRLKLSFRRS